MMPIDVILVFIKYYLGWGGSCRGGVGWGGSCMGVAHSGVVWGAVADPGFGQGGPQLGSTRSCQHSGGGVGRAKRAYVGMGSGACLRAPEAFGVFMAKYAFSVFSW